MENEKITIETIDKLSSLSKLEFTPEEKQVLLGEVSGIIEMLNKCGQVKVNSSISRQEMTINDLRADEVKDGLKSSDTFRNAPVSKNGYLGVPKVVE
ncbi:MAG: Asp-tRNA(Asn)/Glu-tRNA(Gln) amidotransferase subunit GatC [Christensenellales bacterium]